MTRREFKPNLRKSGRNQVIGEWIESNCKEITLPFTKEALAEVLKWGESADGAPFTHQEIAFWCEAFYMHHKENEGVVEERVLDVAQDVEAQWDLYLVNTYSLEELQSLNFSTVVLPKEWFTEWLSAVNT